MTEVNFPQKKVIEPYVKSFKKALGIYKEKGYYKFSIQKLYFARVIWLETKEEKARPFGPCFCADIFVPEGKGYKLYHLLLRAFCEEDTITRALPSQVRLLPVSEGDVFEHNCCSYKLLHGSIIIPKRVMNLDTALEIFAESGLEIRKEDIHAARLSFERDVPVSEIYPLGKKTYLIGVCFLTETIIDDTEYIAYVKAFHGKNSRIVRIEPKAKCKYQIYGPGHSFKTSRGEWTMVNDVLRDYKEYEAEKLRALQQKKK